MRHWRKMTWVLIAWSALILAWAIGGAGANHCAQQTYKSACQAGTGIGVAVVLLIGFFGFLFFALIWYMTRPKGRDCPVCGTVVKRGATVCPSCGHDWAAAAGRSTAAPASPA